MLQYAAVFCSALQCVIMVGNHAAVMHPGVAVCVSMSVRASFWRRFALGLQPESHYLLSPPEPDKHNWSIVIQCVAVAVWRNVLQCSAVCYSVLQCVTVWYSVVQCGAVLCSVVQCGAEWCSVVQCGPVWCRVL